jgi:cyanate permease
MKTDNPLSGASVGKSRMGRGQIALLLVAFWIGFNIRAPLLGVPPILGLARASLHLNYAGAGAVRSEERRVGKEC